ncbi:hypothetical protein ACJZ2D_005350 [Fusarium nematophilum]
MSSKSFQGLGIVAVLGLGDIKAHLSLFALTDAPSPNAAIPADCPSYMAGTNAEGPAPRQSVYNNSANQRSVASNSNTAGGAVHANASAPQVRTLARSRGLAADLPSRSMGTSSAPSALVHHQTLPSSIPTNGQPAVDPRSESNGPVSTVSSHQAKRARIQGESTPGESMYSTYATKWRDMVATRVAQFASAGLLNDTVERPRYRILMESCANEDYFYIALHQVLCGWTLHRAPIYGIFRDLVDPTSMDAAFDILQTVLRKNEAMSSAHLQWFANFPMSMEDLCKLQPNFPIAREIGVFLCHLSTNWQRLMNSIATRSCPLLAYELSILLACPSPGLQAMFFTMSRRWLGVRDGPLANSLNDIFEQDRALEATLAARDAIPSPAISHNNSIADRSGRPLMAQSPVVPSNAQLPSSAAAPSPSMAQFDTMGPRAVVGDPKISNPRAVNHPPPGTSSRHDLQRPGHLYVQTDHRAAPPTPIAGHHSPQMQQASILQPASAGVPQSHSRSGSQSTPHTPILPSNGPARAPVIPSNVRAIAPQRRSSLAHPSQSHPNAQWGDPHYAGPRPQYAQPGSPQVVNHPQLMHPHQANQAWATYPASPHPVATAVPLNHPQPTQPTPQPTPQFGQVYRVPVPGQQASQNSFGGGIPEVEHPFSPYGQASLQIGLLQVGLRSPRRVPSKPVKTRYYQFIKELALRPIVIEPQPGLRHLTFSVPEDHLSRLARKMEGQGLPYCPFVEGSYRYRLRVCVRPDKEMELNEADWVISATHWPSHIFFDFNSHCMGLRRKQHFHKDQPLELTDFLSTGENTLRISFPRIPQNTKPGFRYFVAVEIVETVSHDSAKNLIETTRRIPLEETKRKAQRRLRPSDSDDVIIADENLTISLADPFSASRFNVPVRGSNCKHIECFDLETWLTTRPRKPAQKGGGPSRKGEEPSLVDVWKCPICGLDARPTSLWVDEYLARVGQELLAHDDKRTRTITVNADGDWNAVPEPDDSEDESPGPRPAPVVNGSAKRSRSATAGPPQVIEILDDD